MMNRVYRVVSVAAVLLAVVSCRRGGGSDGSQDIIPDLPDEQTTETLRDSEIEFAVSTYDMNSARAGYSNAMLPEKFVVDVTSDESAYSYKGIELTRRGDDWHSAESIYWADDTTPIEIEAYVPYNFKEADISLQSDQSSEELLQGCDLLHYHNGAVRPTTAAVPIALRHIMSKIYFKVCLSNVGSVVDLSDNPISNTTITGPSIMADLSDPNNIEVISTLADVMISPYTQHSGQTDLGDDYYARTSESTIEAYYEAIVVPQTISAGDLKMSLSVGDDKADWSSSQEYTFESGMIYVITLNLAVSVDENVGGSDQEKESASIKSSSFSCNDWYSGERITIKAMPKE